MYFQEAATAARMTNLPLNMQHLHPYLVRDAVEEWERDGVWTKETLIRNQLLSYGPDVGEGRIIGASRAAR